MPFQSNFLSGGHLGLLHQGLYNSKSVLNVLIEERTTSRGEAVEKWQSVIICKVWQLTEPVVVLQLEEGESGGSFGVVRQFGAYWELLAITQWGRRG